jgi:glycosyltransferase involved in cell wall biosynthesis
MTPSRRAPGSSRLNACTIAVRSRLPEARVLVDSFRRQHADSTFTVLVVDDEPDASRPDVAGAEVLLLDEIGLHDRDRLVMAASYDLVERSAALKPWLLSTLLEDADHAVYFDPDILVARELVELRRMVRDRSILLTPHLTEPLPRDGAQPSEQDILLRGAYNLGFIGVSDDDNARRMLAWWQTRLRTGGVDDRTHGSYLDQRWMDFVPSLFDHQVVRDPSWNVAYWNLPSRPLTHIGDEVLVSGQPLTFFHFAGYSPDAPHLLSTDVTDDPRVRLSRDPVLRDLCDDYAARLRAAGFGKQDRGARRTFTRFDGLELDAVSRRLLQAELAAQELGGGAGLELAGGASAVRDWLLESDQTAGSGGGLSRYFSAVWSSRPDLHRVFPEARSGDPSRFLRWCRRFGVRELGLARWPIDAARERFAATRPPDGSGGGGGSADRVQYVPGVEVVGFLSADLGIGQAARMLVAGLDAAGVDVSTTTYTRTSSRLGTPWTDRPGPPGRRHDVAIVCINADMLPVFVAEDGGAELLADRYRVGLWFWELDDFPKDFHAALEPLDELWVTSEFTADVLRGVTKIPVHTVPLPVQAPRDTGVRIPEVPDDGVFTFLFVFDYLSVFERKNPLGLVEAFVSAFPQPGEARLVIKTINADKRVAQQEALRYAVKDRPDIVLVERYLTRDELDGLMWAADSYVSLHRSEGFGFTMAEAMAVRKPVIATGYSGNMTFMTPENSRLVDFTMVPVPPGCEPYPVSSKWASPRLDEAARMMKQVRDDPEMREHLAVRAAADIAERHSVDSLAGFVRRRLSEIRRERATAQRRDGLRARVADVSGRLRQRRQA